MSFPQYPAYKDSGAEWLGQIPEHWGTSQSRRMFKVRSEPALTTDRMLTASQKYGVLYQADFVEREGRRVVEVILGKESLKHVEPDDFIISMRSFQGGIEWCKLVGSTSFHYVMLTPVKHVHPPFFAHLLKSSRYIEALRTTTDLIRDGQELRFSNFAQVDLPVVPEAEQKLIATFLDKETAKIDALVAEQERLIELLKEKRQAVISHAVTKGLDPSVPMKDSGVAWLGEVPAHWEVRQVRSIASFLTSGPRGWSERVGEEGSLFVQSGDLTDDLGIALSQAKRVAVENDAEAARTRLLVGDVVVCITGAKTGNVAVCAAVEEDAYINQHLCLIRPTADVLPWFLGVFLKSDAGQRYFGIAQYGLKQGLSLENVKAIPLLVPPVSEQEALVAAVTHASEQMDQLIGEAVLSIELLRERRTALISAAVTGQIDVRGCIQQEASA